MNITRLLLLLGLSVWASVCGCASGSGGFGSVTVDVPRKTETVLSGEFALNDPATCRRVDVAIRIEVSQMPGRPVVEWSKSGDSNSLRQAECMQWLCMYFADMKADRFNGSENLRKIRSEIQEGLSRDVYSRNGDLSIQNLHLTHVVVTAPSAR